MSIGETEKKSSVVAFKCLSEKGESRFVFVKDFKCLGCQKNSDGGYVIGVSESVVTRCCPNLGNKRQ